VGEAVRGLAPGLAEHALSGPRRDHCGVRGAGCRADRSAADLARWRGLRRVIGVRTGCRGEKGWHGAAGVGPSRLPTTARSWRTANSRRSSATPRACMNCLPRSSEWRISPRRRPGWRRPGWRGTQRSGQSKRVCRPCSSFSKMPVTSGPGLRGGARRADLGPGGRAAGGNRGPGGGRRGELDRLLRLVQLTALPRTMSAMPRRRCGDAASGLDAVAGSPAGRARALAGLLTAAAQHHEARGDGDCPVCGRSGALTGQWRQATQRSPAGSTKPLTW
jgi:hypothetical protein